MKTVALLALALLALSAGQASAYNMVHAAWLGDEVCTRGTSADESTFCEDLGNGGGTGQSWFAGKRESMQERIARIRESIPQLTLTGIFKPSPEID